VRRRLAIPDARAYIHRMIPTKPTYFVSCPANVLLVGLLLRLAR